MLFSRHRHGDHIVYGLKTLVRGAHLIILQTFEYVLCGWLHQHVLYVHAYIFNHVFLEVKKKKHTNDLFVRLTAAAVHPMNRSECVFCALGGIV